MKSLDASYIEENSIYPIVVQHRDNLRSVTTTDCIHGILVLINLLSDYTLTIYWFTEGTSLSLMFGIISSYMYFNTHMQFTMYFISQFDYLLCLPTVLQVIIYFPFAFTFPFFAYLSRIVINPVNNYNKVYPEFANKFEQQNYLKQQLNVEWIKIFPDTFSHSHQQFVIQCIAFSFYLSNISIANN
eukprot:96671_1